MPMPPHRTAHPYLDGDVIDRRAPRFNQATVASVSLIAVATGWWWLIGLLALQLVVGLAFGRRFCLPCVFYFEVIQPRFGEGEIEDSRPPRFANILGATFLSLSTAAYATGLERVGDALGLIVAALALLAVVSGLCVGCSIYRGLARLRGIRPGAPESLDVAALGFDPNGRAVVQFTHRLCTGCATMERRLRREGHRLFVVDISEHPDLARKYRISVVPAAFAIAEDGSVLERLA
ncbi:MAG: DUF4395 family protein [Actinomycetota bacterium]